MKYYIYNFIHTNKNNIEKNFELLDKYKNELLNSKTETEIIGYKTIINSLEEFLKITYISK